MFRLIFSYNLLPQLLSRLILSVVITALAGCQYTPSERTSFNNSWQQEILEYQHTISPAHPDSISSILSLPDQVQQTVLDLFQNSSTKQIKAEKLARWLISNDGHAMHYDISANLNPADAFQQKRGNCLSFTILFARLAAELGIDIQFNLVDVPDIWSTDNDHSLILYRHINGVHKTVGNRSIFDLALELYDTRYPQKIISEKDAIAQLHSNRAITAMQNFNYSEALHLMKLATSLSPQNEDLWVNLGVITNRLGNNDFAERSFLHAYSLNPNNEITASSLERFYANNNQPIEANKFRQAAIKARENNPYYLYEIAKTNFSEERYKEAKDRITKAIRLHDSDSRFYELSSRIEQKLERYDLALKDVLIAYQLSNEVNDQNRFADKTKLITPLVSQRQLQKLLRQ